MEFVIAALMHRTSVLALLLVAGWWHDAQVLLITRHDGTTIHIEQKRGVVGVVLELLVGELVEDLRLHFGLSATSLVLYLAGRVVCQLGHSSYLHVIVHECLSP